MRVDLATIEKQVEHYLDRIAGSANVPSVLAAYENRIRQLEERKLVIAEQIASSGHPLRSFEDALRTALNFLASPWKLWNSRRLEDQRAVLKLTFGDRLVYARNEGFRTANLTLPFKVLRDLSRGAIAMASPTRFELVLPP